MEVVVGITPHVLILHFSVSWERGKKGPLNMRRCDLEPLMRLFYPARSRVGILRYWFSTASLSWYSWHCYDNHIVTIIPCGVQAPQ